MHVWNKDGMVGYRFCINITTLFYGEIINNLFYSCFVASTDLWIFHVNWWYWMVFFAFSSDIIFNVGPVRPSIWSNLMFGDGPRGSIFHTKSQWSNLWFVEVCMPKKNYHLCLCLRLDVCHALLILHKKADLKAVWLSKIVYYRPKILEFAF